MQHFPPVHDLLPYRNQTFGLPKYRLRPPHFLAHQVPPPQREYGQGTPILIEMDDSFPKKADILLRMQGILTAFPPIDTLAFRNQIISIHREKRDIDRPMHPVDIKQNDEYGRHEREKIGYKRHSEKSCPGQCSRNHLQDPLYPPLLRLNRFRVRKTEIRINKKKIKKKRKNT